MKRDPVRLANESFDLLVVGAGIYGATIASAAAGQGIRVALIDRGDFGHLTSANSQKIIHGGLRYLQHLDFGRMRESIEARRRYMTVAPHLVHPLQCIVPTRGRGLRSRPVMKAALLFNDLISRDRNDGMDDLHLLPRGRTVSAAECLRLMPGLDPGDVTGGAVWFDAMAANTERLTLFFVSSAAAEGACVANYVQATSYLESGNAVRGVAAEDVLTGETFDVRASLVVNAMGPGARSMPGASNEYTRGLPRSWCRAMNVVVNRRLFGDYAVGLTAGRYVDRDAVLRHGTRDFFFVPWNDSTIIGTFYDRVPARAAWNDVVADDIRRMLREINAAYPAAGLLPPDVGFVHAGLLPEAPGSHASEDVQLLKHAVVVDAEQAAGVKGLLSVVGVKYTTAAQVAQQVVRAARVKLGLPAGLPASANPQTGSPARPDPAGEVVFAIRNEMAQKLSDVVFRRTGIGAGRYPGRAALLCSAAMMAPELGWTRQRTMQEVDETEQTYSPLFEAGCVARPEPLVDAAGGRVAVIAAVARELR